MSKDILFTFLALCAFKGLWVLFIFWHLDLWSHKEEKDEEPPTFI